MLWLVCVGWIQQRWGDGLGKKQRLMMKKTVSWARGGRMMRALGLLMWTLEEERGRR